MQKTARPKHVQFVLVTIATKKCTIIKISRTVFYVFLILRDTESSNVEFFYLVLIGNRNIVHLLTIQVNYSTFQE